MCLLKSASRYANTKSFMYVTVRTYMCVCVCRGSASVDQLGTSVCVCICVSGSPWRCLPGAVTSPWLTALISGEAGCKFCQRTSRSTCVCVCEAACEHCQCTSHLPCRPRISQRERAREREAVSGMKDCRKPEREVECGRGERGRETGCQARATERKKRTVETDTQETRTEETRGQDGFTRRRMVRWRERVYVQFTCRRRGTYIPSSHSNIGPLRVCVCKQHKHTKIDTHF